METRIYLTLAVSVVSWYIGWSMGCMRQASYGDWQGVSDRGMYLVERKEGRVLRYDGNQWTVIRDNHGLTDVQRQELKNATQAE